MTSAGTSLSFVSQQTPGQLGLESQALGLADAGPSAPVSNVLLIDDELSMRSLINDYFAEHGFVVTSAADRAEAFALLARATFDLIILDLRLGAESGLDILREVRASSDVPIIITTGHRRDEVDRVVGLELGADDYVVKPFGLRELLARVRVVMRRALRETPAHPAASGGVSLFDGWILDRRQRHLANPDGARVELTKGEYALLLAFLDAPRRPLSREFLLQATRIHEDIYDRSIDVQILRLRRKLEVDPRDPQIIVTVRGVGYVFAASVETRSGAAGHHQPGGHIGAP